MDWLGFCRPRLPGALIANIQCLLMAAGQNLIRFRAERDGSLVVLPRGPRRLSALYQL